MAWQFGAGLKSNLGGLGGGQLGQNIGGGQLLGKISTLAPPGSGKLGLGALAALLGRRQARMGDDGSFVMEDVYSQGLPGGVGINPMTGGFEHKPDYTPFLIGGAALVALILVLKK